MEIDTEQLVLKTATLIMDDQHHTHELYWVGKALDELYPEADLVIRIRKQVKEYKKLTQWR